MSPNKEQKEIHIKPIVEKLKYENISVNLRNCAISFKGWLGEKLLYFQK